ncbi:MAG TPA: sporulation protein YqfD [Bacillota bacterium]|nr:sporulation protein YqfD [Bacillota bacterium]
MQHNWLRWFNGYLIIILRGKRIERFINLAIQKRIQIWNIARYDEQRGKLAVKLDDFFRLKPLLKETGCRVRVMGRYGLPFFYRRVRQRYAFFIGFIAFISMLFLLSNMIWSVEVTGTEKIPKYKVVEIADKIGIAQGKFSFMLDDPDKIQGKLMEQIPEASWIGFEMKGTKAQIRVVEKVLPDETVQTGPKHIIAKKSAIVRNIFASQGKITIKVNDFVRKGDILVSGLIGKEQSPIAIAAKGKVEGEVWYETEVVVPTVQTQAVYTGEGHENYYIVLWGHPVKVWGFGDVTFKQYEAKDESFEPKLRNLQIPISWKKEHLLATESKTTKLNSNEILTFAIEAAKRDILTKMGTGGYVKEEKVLHQRQENDKVYIKMHVITMEDIAEEQTINVEGE